MKNYQKHVNFFLFHTHTLHGTTVHKVIKAQTYITMFQRPYFDD